MENEVDSVKVGWLINHGPPGGFAWNGEVGDSRPTRVSSLEAVIDEPNFKAIWWLQKATEVARSVARVKFSNGSATGFLVAPDVLMTNNHVFENKGDAKRATIQFNYQLAADGSIGRVDEWKCAPKDLFRTNPHLDYSVVRIASKNGKKPAESWGYLNLRHGASIAVGQRVNIVQHPQGRFKEIAFRDNQVRAANPDDPFIQYLTDTDYGTSGSPVFDDWFNVIALHNQRVPDPSNPNHWYRNQGFKISAILDDLGKAADEIP